MPSYVALTYRGRRLVRARAGRGDGRVRRVREGRGPRHPRRLRPVPSHAVRVQGGKGGDVVTSDGPTPRPRRS